MLTKQRSDALVELCKKMISTYSVTGSEKDIALLLCDQMKAAGFDEAWVDDQGNAIGKICGTGGGKTVLLDGHMDTVEVSDKDKWKHNPFSAEIDNSRIYGRGAADMKGALAAMIMAAGWLAKDKRPTGDVFVTGTAMEEIAEGCSLSHILGSINPDVVVIGEASMLNLNIGQRGRGEILVRTKGKPAHSSNPEVGVNAVYKMMKLVQGIQGIPVPRHELLGEGILELTDIISSPYPGASVVPELCSATFDRRLLMHDTKESILEPIRALIAELKKEDPKLDAETVIAGMDMQFYTGFKTTHSKFAPAWCLDKEKNADLINCSLEALRAAGLKPEVSTYKFCTNGSASAGIHNISTIGFGPCAESQAHVVDEYIEIAQLEGAASGYYYLIDALCRI